MANDKLYHFGIKGQRWGVRRFQNEDGTRTAAGKKREAAARKSEVRDTDSMSDEELRNKINRMQNEQQYMRIMGKRNTSPTPKKLRNAAELTNLGIQVADNFNTAYTMATNKQKLSDKGVTDPKIREQIKQHNAEVDKYNQNYNEAKSMANNSKKLMEDSATYKENKNNKETNKKLKENLKGMSDAELKKTIDRLLMEDRYDTLMAPQRISKGEKFMTETLPKITMVLGTVTTVTALATSILNIIDRVT